MPTPNSLKVAMLVVTISAVAISYALNNRPLPISYTVENLNNYTIHSISGWDIENNRSIFGPYGPSKEDSTLSSILPAISKSFSLFPRKLPKNVLIEWESREGVTKHFSVTRNISLQDDIVENGRLVFSILDNKVYVSWIDFARADEHIFRRYGEVLTIDPPPCHSKIIICDNTDQ